MLFCTCVIAVDANLRPYIIKLLIDQSNHFELHQFILLASVYALSQGIMVTSYAANDWFGTKYHTNYRANIPHHFIDRLTKYSYNFFQENMAGSITAKITDAFNLIPPIVFMFLGQFVQFVFLIIVSLFLLSSVDQLFVVASLVWIGIFLILSSVYFKLSTKYNEDYAPIRPKLYGFLSDYISNILSIWSFNGAAKEKDNLNNITKDFVEKGTKYGTFLRNFYFAQGIIITLYMAFILYVLAKLNIEKRITPGDFALVFMVNYKIGDILFSLAQELLTFVQNWGAASKAIEILDFPVEIKEKSDAKELKITKGEIKFEQVKFNYKNVTTLFNEETITLNSKQNIGLVGFSGGGKSTFVNLITRLYDVTDGKITIDNQDIREVSLNSLHQAIAIIPQEPTLFHRSIMENIRYGKESATDKQVFEAAKKARAHEFIEKLPQKYETLVGERGIKLSGGQRQRIAIARAILKDAPILILDEATSALDSITENHIREALIEVMKDKTCIVIAHRLSTIKNMDRILVFDNGNIVEDGSYEELLSRNSLFKRMWNAQNGGLLPNKKDDL